MAAKSLKADWEKFIAQYQVEEQASDYDRLVDGLAEWAKPLMAPMRYKCLFGGRGSGKSFAIADALLIEGTARKCRVLCSREFQISIKESVHYLLVERIEALGLEDFYLVQRDRITGSNGTEFIFKGVRHNINSIKSMAGITHLWIEEAQTISAESWRVLVPTIREEGSEIWVTFNPLHENDVVYQELVQKQRDNAYVRRVNWDMNPHFPSVLDEERRMMQRTDPDAYHHIWEGGFWVKSDAQVMAGKWAVDEFEVQQDWDGPYLGADFGHVDPTALVQCWIGDRTLYVERESYAVRLDTDCTADRWMRDIPGCDRHIIRADCSRPETISYLSRHGTPWIKGAKKWKGSVEDGIAYLRQFDKIVIHPRCSHTIEESRMYSYKVDRLTGDVLPQVADAWNHCYDSIRYALAPLIEAFGDTSWLRSL